jgi:hypothetical protein
MAAKTLAQLRTAARQRAGMENSTFITDAELTSIINQEAADLYDLLTTQFEDYYTSTTPSTFTLTSASNLQSLPADFFKLRGVDYQAAGVWVDLDRVSFRDRNVLRRGLFYGGAPWRAYDLVGAKLMILPSDDASGSYRLWYIPTYTDLVGDSDPLDVIQNWDEHVIVGAAITMLNKEESDTTALMGIKMTIRQRIIDASSKRDAGTVPRIVDVRDADDGLAFGMRRGWWK